jgi:SAM-dependent methyltransferase
MDRVVNTAQAEAWNGPEGAYWAAHQDRWNAINAGYNTPLLTAAGIGETDRVLDIGCGSGQTTRLAARAASRGSALGVDLSAPQLARARELAAAEGLENVAFEQGDAQVHPFPDAAFEVAISRMGVMFFADPVAAFANIRRALRPGGRLTFVCMGDPADNEWLRALHTLGPLLPVPDLGAPGAPGMFSLADPERIRDVLTAAGFGTVRTSPVETLMPWGRDAEDAADFMLGTGPGRAMLAEAGPGAADQVRQALTGAFTPYQQPDGVRLRATAWLVTADRP